MTLEERFWSKVNMNGPVHPVLLTPCWLWCGASTRGYGRINLAGRAVIVSRVAWREIAGREIPEGHGVLHHCDVPACVNYETHLFTGMPQSNTDDMISKGRSKPRGIVFATTGEGTKTCTGCGETKSVTEFYVRMDRLARSPTPACKTCHRGYAAAARATRESHV